MDLIFYITMKMTILLLLPNFSLTQNSSDSNSNTSYFGFGPRVAFEFLCYGKNTPGDRGNLLFQIDQVSQKITNTSTSVTIDPNYRSTVLANLVLNN